MRRRLQVQTLAVCLIVSGCNLVLPSHHPVADYAPVFAAAEAGDLATVKNAVDTDPQIVGSTEWDGKTLLHDAVEQNHADVAVFLLDRGAQVNAVSTDGLTPLHIAAQNGNIPIIQLLLARGSHINAVDEKGWTPLDRAVKWDHPDAATFLLKEGAHSGAATTR